MNDSWGDGWNGNRWQLVDLNAINWISLSVSCSQLSISSCDKIASLQSDIGKRAFIFLKMVSTVAVVVDNNHLLLFTFVMGKLMGKGTQKLQRSPAT